MNRDKRFGLLLSSDENYVLSFLAELRGLSRAAYLRQLFLEKAKEDGLWPPAQEEARDTRNEASNERD